MSRFEDRLNLLAPAPASDALRARLALPAARRRIWTRTVPMAAAAAGLIAAIIFATLKTPSGVPSGPNDAEKEFRAMEETLRRATSLRVSYTRHAEVIDAKGIVQKVDSAGELLLKQGDRLRLTLTDKSQGGRPNPMTATFDYFCDGKEGSSRVKSPEGMQTMKNIAVRPKDLHRKTVLALARESLAVPTTFLTLSLEDLESHLEVSGFAIAADEQGRRIVSYKLGQFDAKVWIDPLKRLPLKRVWQHQVVGTFTETYDNWELDPELPDEMFRPN